MPALQTDPMAAMQLIVATQKEAQTAFSQLVAAPWNNVAVRRELHRTYREKTVRLLDLLRWQNESTSAPSAWDLTIVAQPLFQQALIEADLVDALGEPAEAAELREWAVVIARKDLPPLAFAR